MITRSPFSGLSLLWRILGSTSLAIVLLFAGTAFVVQNYAFRAAEASLENEVKTSAQAYHSLWTERTATLAAVSRIISSMSDVRSAFLTGDQATIRDSAQELWSRVSQQDTIFLVLGPTGGVIASLSGRVTPLIIAPSVIHIARRKFPNQVAGYMPQGDHLFYVVLTPVYVQDGADQALLNILLAGFEIDDNLAASLKKSTSGSDFVFLLNSHIAASTLAGASLKNWQQRPKEYLTLASALNDVEGNSVGELHVIRSLAGARTALNGLEQNVGLIWLAAAISGLTLTYLLARRILRPVRSLDRAALEVARQNYGYRVPVEGHDELGRLATTFNQMCDSIQSAREELIRQERISTIGRLSSSIVHDLRNPLAAIYGGAEILVDSDLPASQAKRLAVSIYRASRRIQELLQDLSNISRGKTGVVESCRLLEVIEAAHDALAATAETLGVRVALDVPESLELPLERARVERLFLNLMNNALEAMPNGGDLRVMARVGNGDVLIQIDDTGPGISSLIKAKLFQPFVTEGKKNGLGLGLALSKQTAIEHGGDLWVEEKDTAGARFCVRLPKDEKNVSRH